MPKPKEKNTIENCLVKTLTRKPNGIKLDEGKRSAVYTHSIKCTSKINIIYIFK